MYFFFQAEDGIRDVAVTGVQTCALPISCSSAHRLLADFCGTVSGFLTGGRENALRESNKRIRVGNSEHASFRTQYRSEEHTSELQSRLHLVCRLLLEKKK